VLDDELESLEAAESVLSDVPQAPIETTIAALNASVAQPFMFFIMADPLFNPAKPTNQMWSWQIT
jgi:hypothetical protein